MSENGYATRDSILGAPFARRFADVEVDGRKFRLRSLTAGEANRIGAKHHACDGDEAREKALASLSARFIVQCVVDAAGNRVFSDTDVAKLLDLDAGFVERLAEQCQKHSGTKNAQVEDAEKNSETTPS